MVDYPPDSSSHGQDHVAGEITVRSWRRVWVAKEGSPLYCPNGHVIRDPLVWEHGCLRCTSKIQPRRTGPVHARGVECGALVYMVGGGLVNPRGQPLIVLTEVSVKEMQHMTRAKLDHDRALAFLGILFPG